MMQTMITAHSGCEDTEIDSLESVEAAAACGVDAIEIDVRADSKGVLRISHNEVSQQEYDEKLTLRSVLETVRPTNLAVNFDIKEQQALYKTLDEAEAMGFERERLIFSGCTGPEQLARDRKLAERGRFFLNIEEVLKFLYFQKRSSYAIEHFTELMNTPWRFVREEDRSVSETYIDDTIALFHQLSAEAANVPKYMLGTLFLDRMRQEGIPLSVWTLSEPDLIRLCLDQGVRNITTRDVRLVLEIKNRYS